MARQFYVDHFMPQKTVWSTMLHDFVLASQGMLGEVNEAPV